MDGVTLSPETSRGVNSKRSCWILHFSSIFLKADNVLSTQESMKYSSSSFGALVVEPAVDMLRRCLCLKYSCNVSSKSFLLVLCRLKFLRPETKGGVLGVDGSTSYDCGDTSDRLVAVDDIPISESSSPSASSSFSKAASSTDRDCSCLSSLSQLVDKLLSVLQCGQTKR